MGSGGLWTPTCCDPLPGCVRARPTDTHIPGCLAGMAGGSVPGLSSRRAEGIGCRPLGVEGLEHGWRLLLPQGLKAYIHSGILSPSSSSLSYLPSLPVEIPPTGLLPSLPTCLCSCCLSFFLRFSPRLPRRNHFSLVLAPSVIGPIITHD